METTFVMRRDELDEEFLNIIKRLFRKSEQIQISISTSTDFDLYKKESKEEYFARLRRSIEELERSEGVTFTPGEFDSLVLQQLK